MLDAAGQASTLRCVGKFKGVIRICGKEQGEALKEQTDARREYVWRSLGELH